MDGFHHHDWIMFLAIISEQVMKSEMSTQIRNWHVVLKEMETAGATSSQKYLRARALEDGKLYPMPTSMPKALFSISAVCG